MKQDKITRRTFVQTSGKLAAGLLLGFYLPPIGRLQAATTEDISNQDDVQGNVTQTWKPNAFIRIMPDSMVTIILHKSEMGQGIYTSLPMMIVEELEADWDKIRIESAPAHPDYYHTVWRVYQGTGASTSISSTWEQHRQQYGKAQWCGRSCYSSNRTCGL
ncbi:MAG: molybdopterin-dependent oxidoreductase [Xenococcaceae cyanobacterium MO_167.B52]|nr:molybdopterin-dependent oxidoreductase [Xenococcaceae cyanobacterium MO_167.B52]